MKREAWLLRGVTVEVPFFQIGPHKVWGATAMILSEFSMLLAEMDLSWNETKATAGANNQSREWLLWTAATAGGWLVGTSINYLLSIVLSMTELGAALNADPADIPQSTLLLFMGVSLVMLLIVGLSIGALQWLLLRRHLAGLQQWAIFTGMGFALGSFAFLAFMGVGAGLTQWLLLRRYLNKTGWWVVISAVAWPLGYMFGGASESVS